MLRGRRKPQRMAGKSQLPPTSAGGFVFFKKSFLEGRNQKINTFFVRISRRSDGPLGKDGRHKCKSEHRGDLDPPVSFLCRLGGLVRPQILEHIGARQSKVFPY